MRFLGVGETCDLGALYLSLAREGHEVRIAVTEPGAKGTLAGMVPRTDDWRAELDWVRAAGADGVVLFESVSEGYGALQDELRRRGLNVIGGSAYGDRLENDRAFAQQVLADLGFPAGHVWEFNDAQAAIDFIGERPGRYVLKYSGPDYASGDNYVGALPDGRDVVAVLRGRHADAGDGDRFILMAFIDGVEMGVGAYFNGERFITPACLDWEHKRFFAGDLGELTGEMGTVATYDRTGAFFRRTLALLEDRLRSAGHVGYVNINTIVDERGVWPLEFSCRFGYPGFAVLAPLQETTWGELFAAMVRRAPQVMQTRPGFCVGVVMTTPPFPYTRKQVDEPVGLPVLIDEGVDRDHLHYGEVGLDAAGQLCTSGLYGWTMVVTGVADTIGGARERAYANVGGVLIPNARYGLDIGERLIGGDLARVERLGLFDPPPRVGADPSLPPGDEHLP
jgi:phosphoribosylamine---glycine ligase